jgi:hypothetical protein
MDQLRFLARMLTEQDIEVWQSNIVESLFLPQSKVLLKQRSHTKNKIIALI